MGISPDEKTECLMVKSLVSFLTSFLIRKLSAQRGIRSVVAVIFPIYSDSSYP